MTDSPESPAQGSAALLGEQDLHLFREGTHGQLYRKLGCQWADGQAQFAVWAPNALGVSVIGDFNGWQAGANPARARSDSSGIWEAAVAGVWPGQTYKFSIRTRQGERLEKADPFARQCELAPATASVVCGPDGHIWSDGAWMRQRGRRNALDAPMSVYEVHLGSWRRGEGGAMLDYRSAAHLLAEYVTRIGFTHVELMPITEHPFYGSWGYQTTGYFAPTSRYGAPRDFKYFVDVLHQAGIGVILDWVPSHFPTDAHGLARFDGTELYEHADPRQGFHPEWKSSIFNYGRNEVRSFLLSSAMYWLDEFHIDGLRVDAVASMLYLDYSREEGEWIANRYGGRENLEAISFLRLLNESAYRDHPDVQIIAEESTAWPMVSRPTYLGGLGFGMKWNMGWMHDTLKYMAEDPIHRRWHHGELTFSMVYAFNENFMLPLSHDEVVHGKGSLLNKMPGDEWQQFANLRLMLGHMWVHPGKKLLFMGGEFGQRREWNHDDTLDWWLLSNHFHGGLQRWVEDLNRLYRAEPALYELDFVGAGFEWIDCNDSEDSVLSFLRKARDGSTLLVVANFTPVPRDHYMVGVSKAGDWRECLNSDATLYGGSGVGNQGGVASVPVATHGREHALRLRLPPLGLLVFRHQAARAPPPQCRCFEAQASILALRRNPRRLDARRAGAGRWTIGTVRGLCAALSVLLCASLTACGTSGATASDAPCEVVTSRRSVVVGSGLPGDPAAPEAASGYRTGTRAVGARSFMVVTANPLASQAGCDVLRNSGSAVDAAVAAQAVLGLVEPQSSGLGGGAFLVHYDASTKRLQTFDGRETAPAAATANDLRWIDASDHNAPKPSARASGRSIGTPGVMRMLEMAHADHGKLPWRDLFTAGIVLARDGFAISGRMAAALDASKAELARDAEAAAAYLNADGSARALGSRFRLPAYADTLQTIAAGGAETMYSGAIAQAIVAKIGSSAGADGSSITPGKTTLEDLARYRARQRAPVCLRYRSYWVCGMGPPSAGGLAVAQALGILENFALASHAPTQLDIEGGKPSVMGVHLVSEAERLAYADRDKYVADTDFVPLPGNRVSTLLDKTYLRQRAGLISLQSSMGVAAPGNLGSIPRGSDSGAQEGGTSQITVVDRAGNVVSMTTTIESSMGSFHMTRGFLLNNQLTDFSFIPTDVKGAAITNRLAPGKRPRSSMAPTLVFKAAADGDIGDFVMATGSPGGGTIIQYVVKTVVGVLDWGLDAQQATNLVNFGAANNPITNVGGEHPNIAAHNDGVNDPLVSALRAMRHTVSLNAHPSGVSTIMRGSGVAPLREGGVAPLREGGVAPLREGGVAPLREGGVAPLRGGADPRREGLVLGDTVTTAP